MKRVCALALLALLLGTAPAPAADVTEAELLQAATALGRQYDANYADKNAGAMAALYAEDGVLISPSGPIVRGREALRTYYTSRFASGARRHAIKVVEVHVQGNGGYGLAQFSVTVPSANGDPREEHGSIVTVYQHDPDGWHMRLVGPSVALHERKLRSPLVIAARVGTRTASSRSSRGTQWQNCPVD